MDYKELFAKTPPTRLFFRAALPGCAGMLASALYQLIDGIFVGRILGDTAFAALNLAMPFVIINLHWRISSAWVPRCQFPYVWVRGKRIKQITYSPAPV